MTNLASIKAKGNAKYTCQKCGLTELIQAHHEIPKDDESLIVLCAECHSQKHPNVPRNLFFNHSNQPYWHNKSASSVAKVLDVHPRTIIRIAKKLNIQRGELSLWDEQLIKNNIRKLNPKPKIIKLKIKKIRKPAKPRMKKPMFLRVCGRCSYQWESYKPDSYYCPRCGYWVATANFEAHPRKLQPTLFGKNVIKRMKHQTTKYVLV